MGSISALTRSRPAVYSASICSPDFSSASSSSRRARIRSSTSATLHLPFQHADPVGQPPDRALLLLDRLHQLADLPLGLRRFADLAERDGAARTGIIEQHLDQALFQGDLLAVMEALYREVTAKRALDRSFEDMVREIQHLIDQMTDDERRAYLAESLFLNTVKYENDKLEAYVKKISAGPK